MINNKLNVTVVKTTDSVDFVVRKMANESTTTRFPGFAVVIKNGPIQGVVTDGDIRRAYANNIDFTESISKIMSSNPITISNDIPEENIVKKVLHLVEQDSKLISEWVPTVVITDKKNHFVDVIDFFNSIGFEPTHKEFCVDQLPSIQLNFNNLPSSQINFFRFSIDEYLQSIVDS